MANNLDKYVAIGEIDKQIAEQVGFFYEGTIYMAPGVKKHIKKRHGHELSESILSDLEKYIQLVVTEPDYVGAHPTKGGDTMEFIKEFSPNILVSIAIDIKNNYIYVSSLYPITDAKLVKGLENNRFKKVY